MADFSITKRVYSFFNFQDEDEILSIAEILNEYDLQCSQVAYLQIQIEQTEGDALINILPLISRQTIRLYGKKMTLDPDIIDISNQKNHTESRRMSALSL